MEVEFHCLDARSSGACLHFNTVLCIVLMLRHSLTHLQTTRLAKYLPVDKHILLHKLVGLVIVALSLVHTTCHVLNAATICRNSTVSLPRYLFTTKSGVGDFYGTAYPMGWLLLGIVSAMSVSSVVCVRRKHFQAFYTAHHLYIVFLIGLLLHAANFWKWLLLPGLVLVIEKTWCSNVSKCLLYHKSRVMEVSSLPNGVMKLTISRPKRLQFHAGDYVYLSLPAVSRFEWHPFTISSPPEDRETLTCHVRTSGDWTRRLAKLFIPSPTPEVQKGQSTEQQQEAQDKAPSDLERDNPAFEIDVEEVEISIEEDGKEGTDKASSSDVKITPSVYIDGPYGTATRRLYDADRVILIATGIGVTPYASVLQSIVDHSTVDLHSQLKKVDLIWINRDLRNLQWFESLLSGVKARQAGHGGPDNGPDVDIHLYVTSDPVKYGTDPRPGVVYGRPDWIKLFQRFKEEDFPKTKVFFCGPTSLAKVLKRRSMENNFLFRKEFF